MTGQLYILLSKRKLLTVCDPDLFLDQVDPRHPFCDRMFHLDSGIHFHEIIIAMFIDKEFNSARTDVVYGFGGSYCFFTHILTELRSNEHRRALFYYFLIAALNRTFAFAEVNYIAMFVAQYLELDMMRFFYEFLQIYRIVSE